MNNYLNISYHTPVMLAESINALKINPSGIYVDTTFGAGGHSRAILEKLSDEGHLIAFDQDPDATKQAEKIKNNNFTFIEANFRFIKPFLEFNKVKKVDGILADLGVSSHQIDCGERGFSSRLDGPLDMRMNINGNTAADILSSYSENELAKILKNYGGVSSSHLISSIIIREGKIEPIKTTKRLKEILTPYAPKGLQNKFYAKVFQALRIQVNGELLALEEMLTQSIELLKKKGRLVVLSYHSLEDRIVKQIMRKGIIRGGEPKDFYGASLSPLKRVFNKVIQPTNEEIKKNNRARSARLRVAEKVI